MRALVRRGLALAVLLGMLSVAVAPPCASMAPVRATAGHCGGPQDHGAPSHRPLGSPDRHGTPAPCAMAVCMSLPLPALQPAVGVIPFSAAVPSHAAALTSAVPQHTTPPPRS